jgi:hypothetical protein
VSGVSELVSEHLPVKATCPALRGILKCHDPCTLGQQGQQGQQGQPTEGNGEISKNDNSSGNGIDNCSCSSIGKGVSAAEDAQSQPLIAGCGGEGNSVENEGLTTKKAMNLEG